MAKDNERQIKRILGVPYRKSDATEGYQISLSLQTQDGVEYRFYLRVSDLWVLASYIEGPLRHILKNQNNRMKGETKRRLKVMYPDDAEILLENEQ